MACCVGADGYPSQSIAQHMMRARCSDGISGLVWSVTTFRTPEEAEDFEKSLKERTSDR